MPPFESTVTKEIRPEDRRGSAGNGKIASLQYPSQLPKIYTRFEFYDYKRSSFSDPTRTQTATIILPVPEQLADNTGIQIQDASFNFSAFAIEAASNTMRGGSLTGAVNELTGKFEEKAQGFMKNPTQAVAALLAFAPGSTDTQQLARSYAGVVPNPHTTLVFNGVDLKEFHFNYRLSPRSQEEANAINNIIRTFKARIHPDPGVVAGSIFSLDYPDLVRMSFVGAKGLPSAGFSFISRFSANFSSGSNMAFFKDGQPIEVVLQFSMREIDIKTRRDYDGSAGRDVTSNAREVFGQENPAREQ